MRHPPNSIPRRPIQRLGIGLEYQEALQPFIAAESDALDFLEVIPDLLWLDRGPDASPRYVDDVNGMAFVGELAKRMPIVCHSIGLSIGSADRFDTEHVTRIADWVRDFRSPWHSDHLAFQRVELEGADINAGVTLPLALDREALDLLVPRVRAVLRTIPLPFLLENNVYFFELPGSEMEEPEFLNELCERAGCGLLVDVHNLYVNSRNHRIDPYRWLSRLNLEHVAEIHLAGGMELEGFYVDAHSGAVPEPVWELLDVVLAGAANLGGIVFEMVGSWYEDLGRDGLLAELGRMREAWRRYGAGVAVAR